MIRSPLSVLAASLLALAAGACRNSPTTGNEQPDLAEDMAATEPPDLTMPAPPADFSVPPPDLTGADLTPLVGQRMNFIVVQYEKKGRDVVVSRKKFLAEEAQKSREEALTSQGSPPSPWGLR